MLQRGLIKQLWWGLAVYFATQLSHAVEDLPRVVSTNVCADIMALSLAAPQQLLSVTRKSQDPALSPMATQAKQFPSNESSAEEIIALHPDIVLASGRWQSMHQQVLLADHGIRVIAVPFPVTWDEIFFTTRMVAAHLRREQTAERLLSQLQHRLQRLQGRQRMFSVLYLRSNGGSAGANTIVDTVLAAVGVSNHATQHGQRGWGRYPLEKLLIQPPDVFLIGDTAWRNTTAKGSYGRHPLMQTLLAATPQVKMRRPYWGCSNWLLIEAAEDIAAQLDQLAMSSQVGVN